MACTQKAEDSRQDVKSDALKIVAELLQSSAKADAEKKPEYIELENMARSAVKARFQPNPPEFSKVVNVTNMTKIWHWLLDGTLHRASECECRRLARSCEGVA